MARCCELIAGPPSEAEPTEILLKRRRSLKSICQERLAMQVASTWPSVWTSRPWPTTAPHLCITPLGATQKTRIQKIFRVAYSRCRKGCSHLRMAPHARIPPARRRSRTYARVCALRRAPVCAAAAAPPHTYCTRFLLI